MGEIRHYDPRVGVTYVYDSVSYYDKEKHQSRSRRKLIGKVDPETGEVVPTGKRGRPRKNAADTETPADRNQGDNGCSLKDAMDEAARKDAVIAGLEQKLEKAMSELAEERRKNESYRKNMKKISSLCIFD